jgi:large subunit ribosomal protein L24
MAGLKLKKGDQVVVIAGKDRGKKGRCCASIARPDGVVVEHVNMIKRHTRANPRAGVTGGIVQREAPIPLSNVISSGDSGRPSRIGYKFLEDGRKVRFAKTDGAILDQ